MAWDRTFFVTEVTRYLVDAKNAKAAVAKVAKGKVNSEDIDSYTVEVND